MINVIQERFREKQQLVIESIITSIVFLFSSFIKLYLVLLYFDWMTLLVTLSDISRFINLYSNIPSFFHFGNKRAIYRLGIISLAHAPVHVTDCPVVNVHVDELSSGRIWQHKLCGATLSANVNINYRLTIKVYYHICTVRHVRIKIIHGIQNVLSFSMG